MTREVAIAGLKAFRKEFSGYEPNEEMFDMAIKALEQEQSFKWCETCKEYDQEKHCCHRWSKVIRDTVEEMKQEQEPKTGHWIRISPAMIYECSECGQNVMTSDICVYKFCHGCGTKMVEPQEGEDSK